MPTSPRHSPNPASDANDGAGSAVSRRTLAKGAAWAAPVILSAAAAPAYAASAPDVIVGKTPCSNGSGNLDNTPFTVQTIYNATLPVGTVFTVEYAGGSTRPTWSGALADNSNATITPGNDTSGNGGRWGQIVFTLNKPMPANTTWGLLISMDIGAFVTGQVTRLTLTSAPSAQNSNTSNDTATHSMYFGNCGN